MNGYSGKILICKEVDGSMAGFVSPYFDREWLRKMIADGEKVLLAEFDVDVTFTDTRQQEIEAYQRAINKERADSQRRINIMLGKIQELQAITHE